MTDGYWRHPGTTQEDNPIRAALRNNAGTSPTFTADELDALGYNPAAPAIPAPPSTGGVEALREWERTTGQIMTADLEARRQAVREARGDGPTPSLPKTSEG